MDEKQILRVLKERWYYTVEVAPTRFVKGFDFSNIAVARALLDSLEIRGSSLLDISTMEGMLAVLASKRGARVVATDSIDLTKRVDLLKELHGVYFRYFPSVPLDRFANYIFEIQSSYTFQGDRPLTFAESTEFGFDIVLSSGLLYHVLNPVEHLCTYRKLCKLGGLLVLETACTISDEVAIFHDIRGDKLTFGGRASWFITTAALELFLRACFFKPLGFCYVKSNVGTDLKVVRLGLIAKAVSERPFADTEFNRLRNTEVFNSYDFKGLALAAQLTGRCSREIPIQETKITPVDSLGSRAFETTEPLSYTEEVLRLGLNDT